MALNEVKIYDKNRKKLLLCFYWQVQLFDHNLRFFILCKPMLAIVHLFIILHINKNGLTIFFF